MAESTKRPLVGIANQLIQIFELGVLLVILLAVVDRVCCTFPGFRGSESAQVRVLLIAWAVIVAVLTTVPRPRPFRLF
jgi:hypothetical protein